MTDDLKPYIFSIMKDPSVLGGPKTYSKIVLKNDLKSKYSNYIAKEKTIPFNVYYSDDDKRFLYHFQIVSTSNPDVIYDVVFEFYTTDDHIANDYSLRHYNVRFFSNSPGFMFTYAYVYNKRKLLVPELVEKFDISVRDEEPTKNNPTLAVGFDYTIFYCMYFLYLNDFYIKKDDIKRRGKPIKKFDPNDISSSFDAFEARSNSDKSKFRKLKDEVSREIRNITHPVRKTVNKITSSILGTTKIIKPAVRKVNRAGTVKKTRVIKKK